MIKVGDYVHITNSLRGERVWSTETYKVIGHSNFILTLDKLYPPNNPAYNAIYVDYVEIYEKATRLAKLKEILE